MRNLRTVIAITLAASAALSLTGCLGGGKLSTASLAKVAKEYEAELLMMVFISAPKAKMSNIS